MEDKKEKKLNLDPDDIMFILAVLLIAIGSFFISVTHGFIITGGVLFIWLAIDNALKVMFTKK